MGKKSRHNKSRKTATRPGHHNKRTAEAAPAMAPSRAPHPAKNVEGWYLAEANRAQQLLDHGQLSQATEAFKAILARLGDDPGYARATILERIGICLQLSGQTDQAAVHLHEAMAVTRQLSPTESVRQLRGVLFSGLGDVLRTTGDYGGARTAYESALKIAEELGNRRAQGVDLHHLGLLALTEGRPDEAQTRYRAALVQFRQIGEPAMEAVVRHQLGRTFQAQRQWKEAEHHYQEAARIREEQGDLVAAAQSWNQLAAVARETGDSEAAEAWYRKAIDVDRKAGQRVRLARHLGDLADLLHTQPGRVEEAWQLARESLATAQDLDPSVADIWRTYGVFADITHKLAAVVTDDQQKAVLLAQARDCRQLQQHAPQILATIAHLGETPSYGRAVALERLARCVHMGGRPNLAVRHLSEALDITETLTPAEDVDALRGMLHARLGETLCVLGRNSEAHAHYKTAANLAEQSGDLLGQGAALSQIGAVALADGELEQAQTHYREALALFRRIHEPEMQAHASHQLDAICQQTRQWDVAESTVAADANTSDSESSRQDLPVNLATGKPASTPEPITAEATSTSSAVTASESIPPFEVTVYENVATEYVFDTDLLIDGPHERKIKLWTGKAGFLADSVRPMLAPFARVYMDEEGAGAVRFCVPSGEPVVTRQSECNIIRRVQREVAIAGDPAPLWRLLRVMDGERTVTGILSELPEPERPAAAYLLAVLAATGPVDISGRTIGRFVHMATKKGVLMGGGLVGDQVLQLVTDGHYRAYADAPRHTISESVPQGLNDFHALTRARRSKRTYQGSLAREEFDALLHTACGVTGTLPWEGHEAKLRAYPSSGALYAVEIYPVVFRVENLKPGVYHYRAIDNVIETIRSELDQDQFLRAMLPVERDMVSGAAALICLAGNFPRHEQKYGEGGYRMMVAEAGHISQTLILAATALGLTARPFGGVFDDLLNQDLGLDNKQEQFLLAVLVGRSGTESVATNHDKS